ncbi:MAG: DEAD/DEAH box helicase [bacterium]|nr:DEAD/DEAH box helicase [bacterium]
MAFAQYGQRRPRFSGRPPASRGFRFNKTSIHPSKYVNQGVAPEAEIQAEIKNSFSDFGLDQRILNNVARHGYTVPTPIQDQSIPVIMQGKDLVGLANTGTGKTAAFLLPLIDKILKDPKQGVLVVVPTRELALQVTDELKNFIIGLPISSALCIGGANIQTQIQRLKSDPHFVIGTPGRLKDLINRRVLDTSLFTNIVLDEVDRMLDIGFVKDIRFLIAQLPEQRQSCFFSATMTGEVEAVMRSLQTDPVKVRVTSNVTSNHIDQNVVRINPGQNKVDVLLDLLTQTEFAKVIVFGRTKHGINSLEEHLSRRGLRVCAIHGNKSQGARQRSLELFKKGATQALLATDVAARGIDIADVTHVINYDEPQTYEDYIHRIGRTGRAGKLGKALTFIVG